MHSLSRICRVAERVSALAVASLIVCYASAAEEAIALTPGIPPGALVVGPYELQSKIRWSDGKFQIDLEVTHLAVTLDLDRWLALLAEQPENKPSVNNPGAAEPSRVGASSFFRRVKVSDSSLRITTGDAACDLKLEAEFLLELSEWRGTLTAAGEGTDLAIHVSAGEALTTWTATVDRGRADLQRWWAVARLANRSASSGWKMAGALDIQGSVTADANGIAAHLAMHLIDVRAANADKKIDVNGIKVTANWAGQSPVWSGSSLSVAVEDGKVGEMVFKNLNAQVDVEPMGSLRTQGVIEALGGRVILEPSLVDRSMKRPHLTLQAQAIEANQVLALFPSAKTHATGRLDGRIPIVWDASSPEFGQGRLELKKGTRAEVIFEQPGLITRSMPTWIPIRPILVDVENGKRPFYADEVYVELYPRGLAAYPSAAIHLVGKPKGSFLLHKLTLDIDVNGRLEELMSLGLNKNLHLNMR
ncbi:MAG TPA: YdbH domain-containing protein [Opitutaceae bacterium]|nr:YdbH domain-containing protein [Opitutaceae bacterium]